MKRFLSLALVLATAALAPAAVDVTPFRIHEERSLALLPDTIGHSSDELTLTLQLKGSEADSAAQYGGLKILEASDDKGTKLEIAEDRRADAAKFKDYDNEFFRKMQREAKRPLDPPQIELHLTVPARGAAKIARLRGTLTLSLQTTVKTIETAALKDGPKKLDIPASVGLAITVKPDGAQSLAVDLTGNEAALESLEVLDAAGKKVSNGMSSFSLNNGPVQRSLDLDKPLDNSMKLVARIVTERKTLDVPFDLKDIKLP